MERNGAISIAKAIAIILMVLCHACYYSHSTNVIVAAFHMPLFFIVSGMCFKEKYLQSGWNFFKRKISGIYWPYLKWCILFLLLHNIFFNLHIYDDIYGYHGVGSTIYTLQDYLSHALDISTKMEGHEQLLGAYWFMKQLFLGNLLFYVICRCCKQSRFWTILILLICALTMRAFHLTFPYFEVSWLVPFSASFIAVGYAIKDFHTTYNQWYIFIICFLFLILGALMNIHQGGMRSQSKFTMIPYMISAVAGTYLCLLISKLILQKNNENVIVKLLKFIGDHTFEIMTLHFLSFKLVSLPIIAIYHLPIKQLAEFPVITEYSKEGWWILYLCFGVGIPIYAYIKIKTTSLNKKLNEKIF